jgi:hypothetical protein
VTSPPDKNAGLRGAGAQKSRRSNRDPVIAQPLPPGKDDKALIADILANHAGRLKNVWEHAFIMSLSKLSGELSPAQSAALQAV